MRTNRIIGLGAALCLCGCALARCNVAELACAPADPYCNPLLVALLYENTPDSSGGVVKMVPGGIVALTHAADAGDYTYTVTRGSGWVTQGGIYTARALQDSAYVTGVKSDGSRREFEIEMIDGGDGTFGSQMATATCNPSRIEVADMNRDGRDDVVIACGAAGFEVWTGNGDGTFSNSASVAAGDVAIMNVGDFNGDGIFDVAAGINGSNSPGLAVYPGNGDGSFQSMLGFTSTQSIKTIGYIARADFNRDGIHDLVMRNQFEIDQYRGTGDANALGEFSLNAYMTGANTINGATEDFNADGFPDLVAGTSGDSDVHLNDGSGFLPAATNFDCGGLATTFSIAPGDYNNDGFMDYACTQVAHVRVNTGNGDGTFNTTPNITFTDASRVASADFNGDGNLDIIVGSTTGMQMQVFLGDGAAGFQSAGTYGVGTNPGEIRIGDFNGDNVADIAIVSNGVLNVFLGN